jgi:hypothetical protein
MTVDALRRALAAVPDPAAPPPIADELIDGSVRYLGSDAARRSIEADTYWPKWDSPWWHMLLLFELGEARRIPPRIVELMVQGLDALPLHIFPIKPEDAPPGTDPHRDSSCHCALGSMHQVLTACGVAVNDALPWVEPWFARYQMQDGGASCDNDAYLADECASSMVGTIGGFEAMLVRGPSPFLDRAAGFLIERRLMRGSPSRCNAAERDAAPSWLLPCFPRFYFYDVLRGLTALVRWAVAFERSLPVDAVAEVVTHLAAAFPDGVIRVRRRGIDRAAKTLAQVDGAWVRGQPSSMFPLLDAATAIDRPCPVLTGQWTASRRGLRELLDAGRIGP